MSVYSSCANERQPGLSVQLPGNWGSRKWLCQHIVSVTWAMVLLEMQIEAKLLTKQLMVNCAVERTRQHLALAAYFYKYLVANAVLILEDEQYWLTND